MIQIDKRPLTFKHRKTDPSPNFRFLQYPPAKMLLSIMFSHSVLQWFQCYPTSTAQDPSSSTHLKCIFKHNLTTCSSCNRATILYCCGIVMGKKQLKNVLPAAHILLPPLHTLHCRPPHQQSPCLWFQNRTSIDTQNDIILGPLNDHCLFCFSFFSFFLIFLLRRKDLGKDKPASKVGKTTHREGSSHPKVRGRCRDLNWWALAQGPIDA